MNRLKLTKLTNTRDLNGIETADGRTIRDGKLIRSGKLSKLPKKTVRALQQRGVSLVIDLRMESERAYAPDTVWDGCRYVHIPLLWFPAYGVTDDDLGTIDEKGIIRARIEGDRIKRDFGNTDNYMIQTYRSMVFDGNAKEALRKFLRLVIEEDGCVLWHCASGKDRAGICAMLVEALLGVDEKTIISDYMISKEFMRRKFFFNKMALSIAPIKFSIKRVLFGLMRIKQQYIKTVIDEMKQRYGGITEYCQAELGITDADISILKEKYLV